MELFLRHFNVGIQQAFEVKTLHVRCLGLDWMHINLGIIEKGFPEKGGAVLKKKINKSLE